MGRWGREIVGWVGEAGETQMMVTGKVLWNGQGKMVVVARCSYPQVWVLPVNCEIELPKKFRVSAKTK